MKLNEIKDNDGAHKRRMRVGRGIGSGKGKTSGRGQKGQTSRSGVAINGFEGGQMPLYMRIPKRGFNNIFAKDYDVVNTGALQKAVDAGKIKAGAVLDHQALLDHGLTGKSRDGIRLLAKGDLKVALTLKVAGASASALEMVKKAGGSVELLAPTVSAAEKAAAKKNSVKKRA